MFDSDVEKAIAALGLAGTALSAADALALLRQAEAAGVSPVPALLREVPEPVLLASIAAELGLLYVDLHSSTSPYRVDPDMVSKCNLDFLRERSAIPMSGPNGVVVAAMGDPRDQDMAGYLRQLFPNLEIALASMSQVLTKLASFDASDYSETSEVDEAPTTSLAPIISQVSDSPVIEWVDNLLLRAAGERASDVHFMYQGNGALMVRFRIDGRLVRKEMPLRGREAEVIGTVLSRCPGLDSSDHTRPQDGAFRMTAAGKTYDVRLAMLPQLHGPTVVMRLLDQDQIRKRLEDMGFSVEVATALRAAVRKAAGAVLITGPTGAGKSTTLYAALNEVNALEMNVLTVEDPVEYRIPYIGQTPVRSDLGEKSLTFARALRAILRLDPDVILLGEIRDAETADVAMNAALTGHLLLSTLHAGSALSVFRRMDDLGVEPFMISEALSLVMSQRLLRRVHTCASSEAPTGAEASFLTRHHLDVPDTVPHPATGGCAGCDYRGYFGSVPVAEVLVPSPALRDAVAGRSAMSELRSLTGDGYVPILQDAHRQMTGGRITVAEMARTLGGDDSDG